MGYTALEHINITVSDARKTTHQLCQIFGWTQRWSGPAIRGGFSIKRRIQPQPLLTLI